MEEIEAEEAKGNVVETYRGFAIHRVGDDWLVPDLKFEDPEQAYGNKETARLVIDREIKFITP